MSSYGFGFLGNVLSFIIFYSLEEFRRISTGLLFILTTIFNTIHLWTLTIEFLSIFDIELSTDAFFKCRFTYFLQNITRGISTYLIIGVGLDRLIRSEFPLRSRRICTCANATIYTIVISSLFIILWSPWLSPEIIRDSQTGACIFNQSATLYFYISQVQNPLRLILVCLIPVVIMLASNLRMLYNMRQSRRRVQIRTDNLTITNITTTNHNIMQIRFTDLDRMLFYIMLANICTFILTQIPFNIYTTSRAYYRGLDTFTHTLVRTLVLIWSSLYFGIAFYLYCLASPFFREKFLYIIRKFFESIKRLC